MHTPSLNEELVRSRIDRLRADARRPRPLRLGTARAGARPGGVRGGDALGLTRRARPKLRIPSLLGQLVALHPGRCPDDVLHAPASRSAEAGVGSVGADR